MRKVIWIGSSRRDLQGFSEEARDDIGFALYHAEQDLFFPAIKPLKGMGGGVKEIIADDVGGTYRVVYAVKFANCLYVLHAFQKKSKVAGKVSRQDVEMIRRRLALAIEDFRSRSTHEKESQ